MTLRAKTLILLGMIVTVALSVTGVFYLRFLENSLRHSISAGLETISSTAAEAISKYREETLGDVKAIAFNLPVDDLENKNVAAIEKRLEKLAAIYTKFENGIFLLDADGRLWADYPSHPEVRGKSFAFREYYQRTMKEQQGIVGTPYRSARTSEPVLTFTELLRGSKGQVLGVLGCSTQLLHPSALGGIRTTKIGRSGYVYVFDVSRLMILHTDDRRVLERDVPPNANKLFDHAIDGFEGVGETVNSRGVRMIISIKHIPGTDWIVAAQQPASEAFAPIYSARRLIFLGIMLAVLAAVVVGALAIRGITLPLAKLREAVLQFSQGTREMQTGFMDGEHVFRQKLKEVEGRDEIGELAFAFKGLSEKLGDSMEMLSRSASDWERTFDSVADAILILDADNRIVRVNRAAAGWLKMEPSKAAGRHCYELVHGTEQPPDYCPHLKTLMTGKECRMQVDGMAAGKIFEITTTPLFDESTNTVGSVHVTRDITESKAAEEELRQSRERYRTIFETATVSIWEEDFSQVRSAIEELRSEGVQDFRTYLQEHPEFIEEASRTIQVRDVNEATLKLYGAKTKEELLGSLEKVLGPESLPAIQEILVAIAEGETYFESEAVNKTLSGERLDIYMTLRIPTEVEGFGNLLVSLIDISGRKKTEQALKESEETARALLNAPTDSAVLLDAEGTILALNETAAGRLGRTVDGLIGRCIYDFFSQDKVESRKENVDQVFRTGKPSRFDVERDGRVFGGIVYPVFDAQGKVARVAVFASDTTERKELEEERIKTSKLEATGILAGGIAHDFNNILTAILGNINLAKFFLEPDHKAFKRMEEAEKASFRAKDLSQQLLTFSKGGLPIKKLTSIRELIGESVRFALSGSNVKCEYELQDDLWSVEIDEGQINQVLNNLVINAVQSMPEGGIVRIRAENTVLHEDSELSLLPGRYVKVSVEDNGVGIKQEHLPRVFDPYFTTKQKGSGFGLATAYSIIKKHGGHIGVKSTLGVGTVFHVLLPACVTAVSEERPAAPKPVAGKGRILLMDDESMVRDVAGRMLSLLGYDVAFAEDGAEAVELYRRGKEDDAPFDAVIMDLTIPGGMGGKETLGRLIEIDPQVKAIVSSGYSNDPIMAHYGQFGFAGVVSKPYRIEEMSHVLHKVMGSKPL